MADRRRPGQLDHAGRRRSPPLHERADALPEPATGAAGTGPDGRLSEGVPRPASVAGAPGRAPRRRGRERSCRLPQRCVRRVWHRQPSRQRVRPLPPSAHRRQRACDRRREVLRPHVRRGSGPVVDGRPAPRGRTRGASGGAHPRRARRRRLGRTDPRTRGEGDRRAPHPNDGLVPRSEADRTGVVGPGGARVGGRPPRRSQCSSPPCRSISARTCSPVMSPM